MHSHAIDPLLKCGCARKSHLNHYKDKMFTSSVQIKSIIVYLNKTKQ